LLKQEKEDWWSGSSGRVETPVPPKKKKKKKEKEWVVLETHSLLSLPTACPDWLGLVI
jgi:hypothetical protein